MQNIIMPHTEPEPPDRSIMLHFSITEVGKLPEPLAAGFAHCSAEAQMLEHAIKSAIRKDIDAFAKTDEQILCLDILKKASLGQAKDIAAGTSSRHKHKKIIACIGFFDFVKMQWSFTKRPEPELSRVLKDAVERRNRLAHQLLAEVLHGEVSNEEALRFLKESSERFFEIRSLVVAADGLSSKIGSVASDGRSLSRFKTTL